MDAKYEDLVTVLRETKKFLDLLDNDFFWSWWKDAPEALREIDVLISRFEAGNPPKRRELEILFASAGSIQEVSMGSGWSGAFITLAEHFDAAVGKAYKTDPPPTLLSPQKPPSPPRS